MPTPEEAGQKVNPTSGQGNICLYILSQGRYWPSPLEYDLTRPTAMAPELPPAKPTNPHLPLPSDLSLLPGLGSISFYFFSAILCPNPYSHFLFPQCKGISAGTVHSMWWAWRGGHPEVAGAGRAPGRG